MLLPEGIRKAGEWLDATVRDLQAVKRQLDAGVPPADVVRDRPPAVAIGQSETVPWARRRVWDCRAECCRVADFTALPETNLDVPYLRRRLRHYPDQYLAANVLEGARLDADVELQGVFVPHLASLPLGFASVDKELHRLHGLGWYDFSSSLPFWPPYLNGQGATSRRLEPDRFRRTTEGGGPRQPTFDASGLPAISINDASHVHHMPQHFLADRRPEFRRWLAARGLPAPAPPPAETTIRFSKWPKERKPQLAWAMRDAAVLRRAAEVLRQFIYSFGDDVKDYFNQLAMASCELHKLGIVFLSQQGDFEGAATDRFPLTFVTEKRLGFGTHGASNLAQRFSDAMLHMFREDMDAAEAEAAKDPSAYNVHEREWLELRLGAQRRAGEPCIAIHRWSAAPAELLPDIPAPTRVDDIPEGYVCPQLRLYSLYMFTDDLHATVVGIERTKRALRTWRRLTQDAGLIMAIPEKRTLGSWGKWLGVLLIVSLGIVAVPCDKILRASAAVIETLETGVHFHVYRSLCGLLEHLRAVNLTGRNVMHGLYRPHGPTGASREGPYGWVTCDVLMTKQLRRWLRLLFQSCGVSVKRALLREELETPARIFVDLTSDACLDSDQAGLGGFCHGMYWYFMIPEGDRAFLTIPVLEFLAVCFNLLNFAGYLRAACESEAKVRVLLRTDALSSALSLPEESAKSEVMVETFQALTSTEAWRVLCLYLMVAHVFGDCNPAADLLSRLRLAEFFRLCAQLGIRPQQVPNVPEALALYASVLAAAKLAASRRAGASEEGGPKRLRLGGGGAPFRIGSKPGSRFLARLGLAPQPAAPAGPAAPPRPEAPPAVPQRLEARSAPTAPGRRALMHILGPTALQGGEPAPTAPPPPASRARAMQLFP